MTNRLERNELNVANYPKSTTKRFENFKEGIKVWRHATQTSIIPNKIVLIRLNSASTLMEQEEVNKVIHRKENFELLHGKFEVFQHN